MYQSLPWLATRISRLVADAPLEAKEMLCESSQRISKFKQNEIVLIISTFNVLMDKKTEEAERLNINAVKAEDLQRGIQETHQGVLFLVRYLPGTDLDVRRPIHQFLAHSFAWSKTEGNIYLSSSILCVEGPHKFIIHDF